MKKIIKLLMIICSCFLFTFVFTSCDQETQSSPEISISLDKNSCEIEVGEETTLVATLNNSSEKILWSVEDASVVSVSDGKVVGLKVGVTKVIASVGDYSASCNVTVTGPTVVGTLNVDYSSLNLKAESTISITANVIYLENEVSNLTYTWSENSNNEVISINSSANVCEVSAIASGSAIITVKTNHLGVDLTKEISVVVSEDISVEISNLTLTEDGYNLSLVNYVPEGENNYIKEFIPNVIVYEGEKEIDNASYSLSLKDDNGVVEIIDNKIVATSVGSSEVVVSYTDKANNEYNISINVEVSLVNITLENHYDIDLSKTATTWIIESLKEDEVTNIKVGETNLTFTQTNETITVSDYDSILCGEYTMVISGNKANYIVNMAVATKVINSVIEWAQVGIYKSGDVVTGYYVLGKSLDYTGIAYQQESNLNWGATTAFNGTFNGRNYSIKNLIIGGDNNSFFGTVGINAVIKNVAFENAKIDYGRAGIISNLLYGKVENVYISYSVNGGWWNGPISPYIRNEATVKNCIIEVGSGTTDIYKSSLGACIQSTSVFSDTYVIGGALPLGFENGDSPEGAAEYIGSDTVKKFDTKEAMANANVNLTNWDATIWDVSNGYPVFKKQIEEDNGGNGDDPSLENQATLLKTYDIDLSKDTTTWTILELEEETVSSISVGNNPVAFVQNKTSLTVSNYSTIACGEYLLTINCLNKTYTANMAVATKVIYTAAEWMQVGVRTASNPDMVGYYTLGADLDFTGIDYVQDTNLYWGSTNGLKGTFNGRNHSINNLVMGTDNNSFFGTVCIGSVVKNVEINATIAWGTVGVISNLMYGTAQNVAVNLTTNGGWWNGAIARFLRSEARVDHCMIKVDGVASAADYRSAISSLVQDASVITNTYVISENFPLGYMGPDSPGAELTETATFKKYANVQAMANANVDLTSWDVTAWDVSAGYPAFKKATA